MLEKRERCEVVEEKNKKTKLTFSAFLSASLCCEGGDGRAVQELTWDGAQVEVVPYDLLELVVQRALLKLQTEVVAQVRVQHFTCKGKGRRRRRRRSANASPSFLGITVNCGASGDTTSQALYIQ